MGRLMMIGEFSKVCRVSIKSLRNYDELGLLKPAEVDPSTGYRYYAQEQVIDALVIALLRSVDMPLAEIAEVLSGLPSAGVDVLKRHQRRLEERVDRETKLLEHVERLITKGGLLSYEITLKEIPALHTASIKLETSPDTIGPDLNRAYGELFGYLSSHGLTPNDVPICFYWSWEPDNYVIEACVPVAGEVQESDGVHPLDIPGGQAASLVHEGPYEELGLAHSALDKWFKEHGYQMTVPCYERYITDPDQETDPAKYRTEVIWPLGANG